MRLHRILLSSLCTLVLSGHASATLIGDEITATWEFPKGNLYDEVTFTVDGNPVGFGNFSLAVDTNTISIDASEWNAQATNTYWSFTSLDFSPAPTEIIGFSIDTDWTGWSDGFVSYTANSVEVLFGNWVYFDVDPVWTMTLLTEGPTQEDPPPVDPSPVPNPATLALLGLGLLGLRLRRKA